MSSRKSLSPISPMIPGVSTFDRTPRQSSYTYPTSNYPPSQPQPQSFIWPLHPSPPAPRSLAPPPPTAMHRRTPSLTSSVSSAHSGDSRPVTPADVAPAPVPYPVKAHHNYPGQPGQAEYMDQATIDRLLRAPAMHTVPLPNVESATNPRVHAWLQSQSQSGSPSSIPIHVEPPSPAPYQRAYAHGTSAFYPPPSSSHRAPPPGPYRPY